jgi:hypothetical protein
MYTLLHRSTNASRPDAGPPPPETMADAVPSVHPIAVEALTAVGRDLRRPEWVLATAAGDLYVSDWRGGVMHLRPDGSQQLYAGPAPGGGTPHPDGIALRADGSLGPRRTVAEFGPGTFPDGLCFDALGRAWITSIVYNRVLRVDPDGRQQVVIEDSDPAHLEEVEVAYRAGTMGRAHLDQARARRLRNSSSLAFGGPDLRAGYLGCLLGDTLERFASPVAGHPPPHWRH